MGRPLQRITLNDISTILEKNAQGDADLFLHLGDVCAYLSWRPENHLKLSLPDRGHLILSIPAYRQRLTHEDVFTPNGFLDLVDSTLTEEKYYLARLTFLGYAGFFRYPALSGTLYKSCGFPAKSS